MATEAIARAAAPSPPGPRYPTPFHFLAAFRGDPIRLLCDAFREHGDVVRFRMPLANAYLLAHPDAIAHVLEDNRENYWKGRVFRRLVPYIGEGLLLSEGELWQRQRRLCQPAFRRSRIQAVEERMTERADALVERWLARRERPLDAGAEMSRLALDLVTRSLFGSRGLDDFGELRWAMQVALEFSNDLFNRYFAPLRWLPTPRMLRVRRAAAVQDRIFERLIAEQRAAGGEGESLLADLLAARDDATSEGMSDVQLRAELVTFMSAGHETTALALTWTWYLLALHPEAEARLHAELGSVLGGRRPTTRDLPRLPYTRWVIQESLRLFPPAWALPRESLGPDEIGGYRIEKRSNVFILPYLTHRHPELWERPAAFWPERFDPERSRGRHRLAYLPFGAGPRSCIGASFAMLEMQLALATIARRVRLELATAEPVVPVPVVTLRPRHPIPMWVRPRD